MNMKQTCLTSSSVKMLLFIIILCDAKVLHVCMRKKKHSILKMKIMVKTTLSGLQVQFVHLSVWVWVCVCMCMCLLNGIGEGGEECMHAIVKKMKQTFLL